MNQKKRRKCQSLRNELQSTFTARDRKIEDVNSENDNATTLKREIDVLESQAPKIARNMSLNIIGLGDKKGRPLSSGSLVTDAIDTVKLGKDIKSKISELSMVIQRQRRHQQEAERLGKIINHLQKRLDQMGCK